MYRALYAHKSRLPKYLSFEAGDKFTLIDTSVSDHWFLAQNGLGEIGYVPFNYIKKVEATTEQQVKLIDGAIEAVHLQATSAGGQYTHDQRLIVKKLVKHRTDVIKAATPKASASGKSNSKRRPAPAPPVEKRISEESGSGNDSALAIVGQGVPIASSSGSASAKSEKISKSSSGQDEREADAKTFAASVFSMNAARKNPAQASGQSSSHSEVSKQDKAAKASKATENMSPVSSKESPELLSPSCGAHDANAANISPNHKQSSGQQTEVRKGDASTADGAIPNSTSFSSNSNLDYSGQPHVRDQRNLEYRGPPSQEDPSQNTPSFPIHSHLDESYDSTASSLSTTHDLDFQFEDLPPPPPEVYDDISDERYAVDSELPPAPSDLTPTDTSRYDDLYNSADTDDFEMYGFKPIEECTCDDFNPKFDPRGTFFAEGSLELPEGRRVNVNKKERWSLSRDQDQAVAQFLKPPDASESEVKGSSRWQTEMLERAQACCVDVQHGDCEEMIGEFQKLSSLSHEESHWALLAAMNLLATKVPHIKPTLDVVALRFHMAHECRSTGRNYQCEDALALERYLGELEYVTNDSQQRGHYLEDDLDSILDITTGLCKTLNNAKHCVSVAAIQKDNYIMVEVISKYYQMETRWVIHSCLLELIETICRLNPQAILEFLYSELPQELVAEMQQHSHDDNRLIQISKTLGTIFIRGKCSPHKLSLIMDIHFFIWLLGNIEAQAEIGHHSNVEMLVALVCSYHLQHVGHSQNPLTEALKMAQGHTLLECALMYLSKHDDPTRILESGIRPKVNSVVLLLSHLFDNPDTSDLLYTNDVEALIGIFEEFLRDLSRDDPMRKEILQLLRNFLHNYPSTMSLRTSLAARLGPLLMTIEKEGERAGEIASRILDENRSILEDSEESSGP